VEPDKALDQPTVTPSQFTGVSLLPGYEHDIEQGAGLNVTAGNPHVVIHTTESPRGSYNSIRNLWRGSNNWGKGLPHFLADGSRYVQLLPLNVGAYTLENRGGGADTNRSGPVIQVEICGYANDDFNDVEIEAMAKWLADLVKAGIPLDLSQHPHFYGANEGIVLARYDAPQRFSAADFQSFNGYMGHQHCPENAHWDPGRLDADRVERQARAHLGESNESEDEDMTVVCGHSDGRIFACWGLFKRHLSQDELNGFLFMGAKDLGRNDGFLALLTEIPRGKIDGN
jgi:hypothetical protein